jgi:hypothetical protein
MAGLSACLKKVGLEKHEAAILKGLAGDKIDEGLDGHAAAEQAVREYIETLLTERADIARQVLLAGGVMPEEPSVPDLGTVDASAHDAASSPRNQEPEPTPEQKEAGNYKKGHVRVAGLDVAIENPAGSWRWSLDTDRLQKVYEVLLNSRALNVNATIALHDMRNAQEDLKRGNPTEAFHALQRAQEGLHKHGFTPLAEVLDDVLEKGWRTEMASHYGYVKRTVGKNGDQVDVFIRVGTPLDYDGPVFVVDQQKGNGQLDEHKIMLGWPDVDAAKKAYLDNYERGWGGLKNITEWTLPQLKQWLASGDLKRPAIEAAAPLTPAEEIASRFLMGKGFDSIGEAREVVGKLIGKDIKPGTPEAKLADEIIELGAILAARDIVRAPISARQAYGHLVHLYEELIPSLNVRTSGSIERQAYSTPLPLAFAASELAEIDAFKSVYEPTAGNGALLIAANPDSKGTEVNEIDPQRAAALAAQGFKPQSYDATERGAAWPGKDVVIANPPFGVTRDKKGKTRSFDMGGGYTTHEVDHVISLNALDSLKDDGRAVLIIGGVSKLAKTTEARSDAYNGKAKREFFFTLYNKYRVVDHFTVSGDLYAKQGAAWPVDVIVISGRGKSTLPLPAVSPPREYTSWEQLAEVFDVHYRNRLGTAVKGDIPEPGGESTGTTGGGAPEGGGAAGPGQLLSGPGGPTQPGVGGAGAGGGRGDAGVSPSGGTASGAPGTRGGGRPRTGVDAEPGAAPPPADAGGAGAGLAGAGAPQEQLEGGGAAGGADAASVGGPAALQPSGRPVSAEADAQAAQDLQDALGELGDIFGKKGRLNITPEQEQKLLPVLTKLFDAAFRRGYHKFKEAARYVRNAVRQALGAVVDLISLEHLQGAYIAMSVRYRSQGAEAAKDVIAVQTLAEIEPPPAPPEKQLEGRKAEAETEHQVVYEPASTAAGLGTLIPANLKTVTEDSLRALERAVGDIDEFVMSKLGWTREQLTARLGAEQVDALALALHNFDKGSGFIIGDQTGIGKGRVVASIIAYALKEKRVPIFVTEKPNLYSDIYRDLKAIGLGKVRMLMTNAGQDVPMDDGTWVLSTPPLAKHNATMDTLMRAGKLSGYDVILTTYNQMQTIKGGQRTLRMNFLEQFANGGVVIFDESHNAGGTDASRRDESAGKTGRAGFARSMAAVAHSVMYSSATYAKRPSVMDLYFKTDMRLAVEKIEDLPGAIAAGGVPLQQVVATMLAKAGQYIRRERSFSGVRYDVVETVVDKEVAQRAALLLREINNFDRKFVRPAISKIKHAVKSAAGTAQTVGPQITSTSFGQIMHNLIDQTLLQMKVVAATQNALEALKADQKVVLTVANTMGSFIEENVAQTNIHAGDAIRMGVADLFERYLQKTRRYTYKAPFQTGKGETIYISDEQLGPLGVVAFNRVLKMIRDSEGLFSDIPLSPIDYMRAELRRAGYKVEEITGRTAYLEYRADGTVTYEIRPSKETKIAGRVDAIRRFNSGESSVIIINQAGATGLSLHASETFADKRQRHMMIVQTEKNIDTHMQMLGRVHRTGQVVPPQYSQLAADIPAELRPAAVLAKKMASLNANTTASRRSAVTAETVDFMNVYGDQVAARVMWDNPEIHDMIGNPLAINDDGDGFETDGAITKVTGHIPLLDLDDQRAIYDLIVQGYRDAVELADAMGENALEAKTLPLNARPINKTMIFEGSGGDSPFSQPAYAERMDVKKIAKPYTPEQVTQMVRASLGVPESDQSILELAELAEEKARAMSQDMRSKEEAFTRAKILDATTEVGAGGEQQAVSLSPDESKAVEVFKLNQARYRRMVETLLERYQIGTAIELHGIWGSIPGIVLDIEHSARTKNPVSPGSWKVKVAVPDAIRQLKISLSSLTLDATDTPQKGIGMGVYYGSEPVLPMFSQAQSVTREERTIMTGNLLAAFGKFQGGQVAMFTDNTGAIRQGVVMPARFDLGEAISKQPVAFTTPEQIIAFMDRTGTKVFASSGLIGVEPYRQHYRILADPKKGDGGRYYLDQGMRDIAGDFTKVGQWMRVEVDEPKAARALGRAMELGAQFEATSNKDVALDVTGQKRVEQVRALYGEQLLVEATRGNYRKGARPDATPAIEDSAVQGVLDLYRAGETAPVPVGDRGWRPKVRYLAKGIAERIAVAGTEEIRGQVIRNAHDLAAIMQLYRDPRFETMRWVFAREGKAVGHVGVSARLPSITAGFPMGVEPFQWLKEQVEATGADAVWPVHNHPSGNPEPSIADQDMQRYIARMLAQMSLELGREVKAMPHVIIDTNSYAVIENTGEWIIHRRKFGDENLLVASIDHEILGITVRQPEDVARVGRRFKRQGWITLIAATVPPYPETTRVTQVRAVAEVPEAVLLSARGGAVIRRFARQTGAMHVFAAGFSAENFDYFTQLTADGFLLDAVDEQGIPTRSRLRVPSGKFFGADVLHARAVAQTKKLRAFGIPADAAFIYGDTSTTGLKMHPDYADAKQGDFMAAARLVEDMVTSDIIERMEGLGPVIFAPVSASERRAHNRIPGAMAAYLAKRTANKHAVGRIVQGSRAWHTGAKLMDRMLSPATFLGKVEEGGRYVLVDDVVTSGATLADLADFIQANGAQVVGIVTLSNMTRGSRIAADPAQLRDVEAKHGSTIQELFGIDHSALTAVEADYLLRFRSADTLRARAAEARRTRGGHLLREPLGEYGAEEAGPIVESERLTEPLFEHIYTPEERASATAILGERVRESISNRLFRVPVQALGIDRRLRAGIDLVLEKTWGLLPEKAQERLAAGLVSEYGLDEGVVDRRALMYSAIRRGYRGIEEALLALGNLTRAESRVAYEWMNADNPQAADYFMQQLSDESIAALTRVRQAIDRLSREAVRLDQLGADTYERHRFAYLRRSYETYVLEATPQQKAMMARAKQILGDQYKGRGISYKVDASDLSATDPTWWGRKAQAGRADLGLMGEKFLRLERRAAAPGAGAGILEGMEGGEERPGRLLEVKYWPAEVPVPLRLQSWQQDRHTWEVRNVEGSKVSLWRDFTREERERMGEIDEVRFAIARTLQQMIHDVEVGRYLEWIANTHALPEPPAGAVRVEAAETLRQTYTPKEWVKVPSTEILKTGGVKKYGKLAGLWVPGPIWNDVRQTVGMRYEPLGRAYATMLRAWKISKTALSPAVHMNNVMANVIMADWHDVSPRHVLRALEIMLRDKPAHQLIMQKFADSGAMQGMYVLSELQKEQLRPLMDQLRKEVQEAEGTSAWVQMGNVVSMIAHGRLREAVAAARQSAATGVVRWPVAKMMALYEAEDAVFRLAAFIKAKSEGADDIVAGRVARDSFLNYEINAPWINIMRNTAFPFIGFTYRAIPELLNVIRNKPWKLMKLATILGAINALGAAVVGADDDEERKLLPEEKAGWIYGVLGPKLLRMPWNDDYDAPVFLDVRRFIPVGDIFDIGQTNAAFPLLPFMVPGGPLGVLAELFANKVQFTGKPIVLDTDTPREQTKKLLAYAYRSFAPNAVWVPGSYAWNALLTAGKGKTDVFGREQSVGMAVASGFGLKLAAYPKDVGIYNANAKREAQVREIREQIGRLKREYSRNGITDEEFAEGLQYQLEKLEGVNQEYLQKVD